MNPTPTTGTSLEVLAPYLPYQIEVALLHHNGDPTGEQHKLRGLDPTMRFPIFCGATSYTHEVAYHGCLPVLRPFGQLCTPLEDGTVPFHKAIDCSAAVKGLLEFAYGCEVDEVDYVFCEPADGTMRLNRIYLQFRIEDRRLDASFWADGTALVANEPAQCLDYLRSQHFAPHLNGRPLVEGVDFIAKKAGK